MAIYAISDLHLSFGCHKPMDIFGKQWSNYEEKIKENWEKTVKEQDTVILAGDFSWATYLEETVEDFRFLNALPGKKILLKGNHDYWWNTLNKMNIFIQENQFHNISFLYNNHYEVEGYYICGTRFWGFTENYDNAKIFHREYERLELSFKSIGEKGIGKGMIAVTHYPPDEVIVNIAKQYFVNKWIYGHIHSNYEEMVTEVDKILGKSKMESYLTSCDYLNFNLVKIIE